MRKITARVVLGIRELVREWCALILLALITAWMTYEAKTTGEPAAIAIMGWCWGLLSATWAVALAQKWEQGG